MSKELKDGEEIEIKGFIFGEDGSINPSNHTLILKYKKSNEPKKPSLFRQVDRDEYFTFIDRYPCKLSFDCTGIVEPPMGSYNDFSKGDIWPRSIVAKESRDWVGPNGETDNSCPGKFWRYYIKDLSNFSDTSN